MPPIRTGALILHTFPFGETSRILRLLTPDFGVRSVIAKGACGPRSRFGGILEPFTQGEAQYNQRPGRDLHTLTAFTLVRSRQAIGRDFSAFTGASLIAELLIRFGTEEPGQEIFDTVVNAFDRLAEPDVDPVGSALAILWNLIALFGFKPEMQACIRCGRTVGVEETTRFDPEAGGVACFACRTAGRTLPASVRLDVLHMCGAAKSGSTLRNRALHRALFSSFLASHLLQGQPLRSLPLFLDQLR